MQKGFFGVTNITTSTSTPPVNVKTVIKGKGDPGYLLTASEHFQLEDSLWLIDLVLYFTFRQ